MGFSSNTLGTGVVFAKNVDFTGNFTLGAAVQNTITTDGQLIIGHTALNAGGTHIDIGKLTSPGGTVTIGYSSPNITLDVTPGTTTITLVPDSGGGITANVIPVIGYADGASKVMKTFKVGGSLEIANQTFLSQYVVDTNTTDGQAGTYSTLQAAITQAIADGATGNAGLTIFVRNITVNENITVATASVKLNIVGVPNGGQIPNSGLGLPQYTGSFTNSGSGQITFSNFDFTAASTVTCSGTGLITLTNGNSAGTLVVSNVSAQIVCNNFQLQTVTGTISNGALNIYYAGISGGTFTFSNAGSMAVYYANSFSGTITGSTSSTITFTKSYLPLLANNLTTGTLLLDSNSYGIQNFYSNTNVTYQKTQNEQGNVIQATRTAISYAAFSYDHYIGVTSTAAPRTITLPTTNVIKNQCFIVKDESGAAGTNNISVVVAGGVKTIDGVATYTINNNYGSVEVIYDGTNFFIL